MKIKKNPVIAIIGLGYTGLPLALQFGKFYKTIGFDILKNKVNKLNACIDETKESNPSDIKKFLKKNIFTADEQNISHANIFVVAVPTPVTYDKKPDLKMLKNASKIVGKYIRKGSIVIYESTVYPGCTEDVCVKILKGESKLKFNKDFFCGYSPERINPGDKKRKIQDIVKITSGSSIESANYIDNLYQKIIKAGTFKVKNIKTAEAAKVIENIQRDLNIALINEFSIIFRKMKINTKDVIEAAATKWNFSKFMPGLVGGHCISVDPYYLTFIAKKNNINPKVILAGRKTNDQMPNYIAQEIFKKINLKKINKCLLLGVSFKEDCPDIRNSKVFDLIKSLNKKNILIDIYDPIVDKSEVYTKHKIKLLDNIQTKIKYEFILIAVKHKKFKNFEGKLIKKLKPNGFIFDIKSTFKKKQFVEQL